MIEEPKDDGFYWLRLERKEEYGKKTSTQLLSRISGHWFLDRNGSMMTWQFLKEFFGRMSHLIAIEPVTPPSWERKP